MTADPMSMALGVCLFTAAFCLGLREILLGPHAPNFPPAPTWLRVIMFLYGAALAVRGLALFKSSLGPHPEHINGWAVITTMGLVAYHAGMLGNVLSQRLPLRLRRRLDRVVALVSCRKPPPTQEAGVTL